jgi:metal-dependent amidase/aminoacylase/carboxypeptidase family protein
MGEFGLKGTLKVFGAPGEEQAGEPPYFVRDGHFKDVECGCMFTSARGSDGLRLRQL